MGLDRETLGSMGDLEIQDLPEGGVVDGPLAERGQRRVNQARSGSLSERFMVVASPAVGFGIEDAELGKRLLDELDAFPGWRSAAGPGWGRHGGP